MTTTLEQRISRSLRAVLAETPVGASIEDSDLFRDVVSGLGWFLPCQVLNQVYRNFESLDGIWSLLARKTGDAEVEILGVCWLMSDQCVTRA